MKGLTKNTDGNICTVDTCDPAVPGGCVYTPYSCDGKNCFFKFNMLIMKRWK